MEFYELVFLQPLIVALSIKFFRSRLKPDSFIKFILPCISLFSFFAFLFLTHTSRFHLTSPTHINQYSNAEVLWLNVCVQVTLFFQMLFLFSSEESPSAVLSLVIQGTLFGLISASSNEYICTLSLLILECVYLKNVIESTGQRNSWKKTALLIAFCGATPFLVKAIQSGWLENSSEITNIAMATILCMPLCIALLISLGMHKTQDHGRILDPLPLLLAPGVFFDRFLIDSGYPIEGSPLVDYFLSAVLFIGLLFSIMHPRRSTPHILLILITHISAILGLLSTELKWVGIQYLILAYWMISLSNILHLTIQHTGKASKVLRLIYIFLFCFFPGSLTFLLLNDLSTALVEFEYYSLFFIFFILLLFMCQVLLGDGKEPGGINAEVKNRSFVIVLFHSFLMYFICMAFTDLGFAEWRNWFGG